MKWSIDTSLSGTSWSVVSNLWPQLLMDYWCACKLIHRWSHWLIHLLTPCLVMTCGWSYVRFQISSFLSALALIVTQIVLNILSVLSKAHKFTKNVLMSLFLEEFLYIQTLAATGTGIIILTKLQNGLISKDQLTLPNCRSFLLYICMLFNIVNTVGVNLKICLSNYFFSTK